MCTLQLAATNVNVPMLLLFYCYELSQVPSLPDWFRLNFPFYIFSAPTPRPPSLKGWVHWSQPQYTLLMYTREVQPLPDVCPNLFIHFGRPKRPAKMNKKVGNTSWRGCTSLVYINNVYFSIYVWPNVLPKYKILSRGDHATARALSAHVPLPAFHPSGRASTPWCEQNIWWIDFHVFRYTITKLSSARHQRDS